MKQVVLSKSKGAGQSNGLHTMHPTYIKQGLTIQKVTLQQKILPDSHSVKAGIWDLHLWIRTIIRNMQPKRPKKQNKKTLKRFWSILGKVQA